MGRIKPGVKEYFRLRPKGERLAEEVDEEIAFHIEQRVQALVGSGMPEADARAEAERRFGGITRANMMLQRSAARREYRMSVREWFIELTGDVRYAVRSLAREPLVSVIVIVTLALGIGANATMFGIIDQYLLRGPAHIVKPRELRRIYIGMEGFNGAKLTKYTGYPAYTAFKERTKSFSGVAAYTESSRRTGEGEDAHNISVAYSTADLFPLLGVSAQLGRFYTDEEAAPSSTAQVAVIDYDTWRKEYGGAKDVIGKPLVIGKTTYSIIGVAPRGFTGPERTPVSVWMPLPASRFGSGTDWATTWCCNWLYVVGRLKNGVTDRAAADELTRVYRDVAADGISIAQGRNNARAQHANLVDLPISFAEDGTEPAEAAVTRWLMGVSFIVLMVACANVVNLLLARAVRRRREVSVRLAMGISRARLTRLLISESFVLAVAGGIAALAVAYWGGKFIQGALIPNIYWESPVNMQVLLFCAGVTVLVGLITGLAPAMQASSHDLAATLKATTSQGGGYRRSALRSSLTILQAALSLLLLVGAALFVRSLIAIDRFDLGIDANHILAVWASLPPDPKHPDDWEAQSRNEEAMNRAFVERLKGNSAIAAVGTALGTPMQNSFGVSLFVPGRDSIPDMPGGGPFIMAVSPEYFDVAQTKLRRGRLFARGEGKGTAPVVVINETMASTLWPGEDPLTKCLIIADKAAPCAAVVGVVQDVHRSALREKASMQYYIPQGQERNISGSQLLVRVKGDADAYLPVLKHELFAQSPPGSFFQIDKLSHRLDPEIRPWKLGATMFLAFGALALLIAAIGLYSLMAYSVSQRRTELGIRLALGSRVDAIIALVLAQGLRLASAGILIGILIALLASRYLQPLLFNTSARDFATFALVSAVLLAIASIACLIPAIRAGRVNPVDALRME